MESIDLLITDYYRSGPEDRYNLMLKIIEIQDSAGDEIRRKHNPNFMYALSYGRLSKAARELGREDEAEYYLNLATKFWQKRLDWNYEYQTMLPITPSPSDETAKQEVQNLVVELDRELAKSIFEN